MSEPYYLSDGVRCETLNELSQELVISENADYSLIAVSLPLKRLTDCNGDLTLSIKSASLRETLASATVEISSISTETFSNVVFALDCTLEKNKWYWICLTNPKIVENLEWQYDENSLAFIFTLSNKGEIINGGFEDDFDSWTVVDASISTTQHHSGSKCADLNVYNTSSITQQLNVPVPRGTVSSFTLWSKSSYLSLRIVLTFTDNTSKYRDCDDNTNLSDWYQWDILSMTAYGGGLLFPSGKTLKSIQIIQKAENDLYIDDVSLS